MIVVVPARGGSRRVPRKNLREVGGRPLIAWTLATLAEADIGATAVVSTEDAEIADAAAGAGVRVIHRPHDLATDTASTEGVLVHAIGALAAEGISADWVMTLPPTSPLRTAATITSFAGLTTQPTPYDCFFAVHADRGDFWRRSDAGWARLFPDAPRTQQQREPLYVENSAVYLTRIAALQATGSILGEKACGVEIDRLEGLDLNDELDFAIADAMLSRTRA